MIEETTEPQRVNKREFIARVATRSGQPRSMTSQVYEAVIEELSESIVERGEMVVLTGFGRFFTRRHKGHRVRFGKDSVDDYLVVKFAPSRSMKRLVNDPTSDEEPEDDGADVSDRALLLERV